MTLHRNKQKKPTLKKLAGTLSVPRGGGKYELSYNLAAFTVSLSLWISRAHDISIRNGIFLIEAIMEVRKNQEQNLGCITYAAVPNYFVTAVIDWVNRLERLGNPS